MSVSHTEKKIHIISPGAVFLTFLTDFLTCKAKADEFSLVHLFAVAKELEIKQSAGWQKHLMTLNLQLSVFKSTT